MSEGEQSGHSQRGDPSDQSDSSDDTIKSKDGLKSRLSDSKDEHVTLRKPKPMTPVRVSTIRHGTSSGRHDTSIDRRQVRFKVPKFSPEDPELWFALLERQFEAFDVIDESIKFSTVVTNLDIQHAKAVKDIIIKPPKHGGYDKIKTEIIRRLSASREVKVKQLLTQEKLGDRKPSQFLRHLQDLAGSSAADDIVRQIWSNQLPIGIQTVLASQAEQTLDQLADLADRIHDLTSPPVVAETSAGPPVSNSSSKEIAELRKMVERLEAKLDDRRNRSPSRSNDRFRPRQRRSPSRSRSRSNSSYQKYPVCWYHSRFGPKASSCVKPCDYNKASGKSTGSR